MRGSRYRPRHPRLNGRVPVTIGLLLSIFTFVPPHSVHTAKGKLLPAFVNCGTLTTNGSVRTKIVSVTPDATDLLRLTFLNSSCGSTMVEAFTKTILPGSNDKIVLAVDPDEAQINGRYPDCYRNLRVNEAVFINTRRMDAHV